MPGTTVQLPDKDGNAFSAFVPPDPTVARLVTANALPLPTGAATAANQATANTALATIAGVSKGTGNVDANTLRTTLALDGPGVANLTSIKTATETTASAMATQIAKLTEVVSSLAGLLKVQFGDTLLITGTLSAVNQTLLGMPLDVRGYKQATISYHTGGAACTATMALQVNEDPAAADVATTWRNPQFTQIYDTNATTQATLTGIAVTAAIAVATPTQFTIPLNYGALRLRMIAYTSGTVTVTVALSRMVAPVIQNVAVVNTASVSAAISSNTPSATVGGAALHYLVRSVAGTNLVNIKATAFALCNVYLKNRGATEQIVKLYLKTGAPVLATDVPWMIIPLAPGEVFRAAYSYQDRGATGLAMAILGAGAINDTDATPADANAVIGKISYV